MFEVELTADYKIPGRTIRKGAKINFAAENAAMTLVQKGIAKKKWRTKSVSPKINRPAKPVPAAKPVPDPGTPEPADSARASEATSPSGDG